MEKTKKSRKAISVVLVLAMILSVVAVGFTGAFTASAADTVTLVPLSINGYNRGAWITQSQLNDNASITSMDGPKVAGPGQYIFVFSNADIWYLGTDKQYAVITVDSNLNVSIFDAAIDWQGAITNKGTNVAKIAKSSGATYTFGWGSSAVPLPRGNAISDSTLRQWATITQNRALTQTGGARQGFSWNSVKTLTESSQVGAPARSVAVAGGDMVTVTAKSGGSSAQFMQMKVDPTEYTSYYRELKGRSDYTYDDYFLHDYYCQGIWDAMPANYGWQQDQYTTPGRFTSELYKTTVGKGYAISLGGQNPWYLNDYIEKNAASLGWKVGYDEVQGSMYLWHKDSGTVLTYENEDTLNKRLDYIDEQDLGGIIVWEMSGDYNYDYPMTTILKERLKDQGKNVVGYFTNWSVYNDYHQSQDPTTLAWDLMTHVNYSFYQVGGTYEHEIKAPANTLNSMDRYADDYSEVASGDGKNMLAQAASMKALYPDTKLMVSVGGWTRGDGFYEMIKSEANMNTFIKSVVDFYVKYPFFDGIDLDWEYPGQTRQPDFDDPADRGSPGGGVDFANYVLLVQKLRTAFDQVKSAQASYNASTYSALWGKDYLITACAPASPGNIRKQDLVSVAELCDFVNIMTYDYHGAFDPIGEINDSNGVATGEYYEIGYNAPLYGRTTDKNDWSTANTIEYLLYKGIPSSKMNIGTPYYSRGWSGIPTITNDYGQEIPAGLTDSTPFDYNTPTFELSISPKPETMALGETKQITASFSTTAAETKYKDEVVWKSWDTNMATVDQNGLVTIVGTARDSLIAAGLNPDDPKTKEPEYVTISASAGNQTDYFRVYVGESTDDYTDLVFKTLSYQTLLLPGFPNGVNVYENQKVLLAEGNGRTMIPFRFLGEAMGATVNYYESTKTVEYILDGKTVTMSIDDPHITINGAVLALPDYEYEPARQYENDNGELRTYVHVRLIADAFGLNCKYLPISENDEGIEIGYIVITNNMNADEAYFQNLSDKARNVLGA